MLVKTNETKNGRDIYIDAKTGQKQTLIRGVGKHSCKIPSDIFGRFIKPMYDQKWIAEWKKVMYSKNN